MSMQTPTIILLNNPRLTFSCASLKHLITMALIAGALLVSSCGVSPETQAKIDQYNSTIPDCSTAADCDTKWARARSWALENSDYPIYTESDTRIRATSTLTTTSGVGVVITREGSADQWRFLVEIECFSAGGCGNVWDTKLDFNRVVNGG